LEVWAKNANALSFPGSPPKSWMGLKSHHLWENQKKEVSNVGSNPYAKCFFKV